TANGRLAVGWASEILRSVRCSAIWPFALLSSIGAHSILRSLLSAIDWKGARPLLRLARSHKQSGTRSCRLLASYLFVGAAARTPRGPSRSCRQGREPPLQKPTDCWIALETDGDFVRIAGFAISASLGHELRAGGPVGLVFGEPGIGGDLLHCLKGGLGTMN